MVIEINPLTPVISVKVISFFEISFVTRKIVSGTTRFCSPPLPHLFCPRYDQIPSPFPPFPPVPPPRLSCQNYFLFFFVSISQFTNYSQTCLRWHRIKHLHCIRRHIPEDDCLIQGWLNWTNKFCPHFLHQTQIISIIVPIPPNFSPFPLVADCGVLLEIVDARMS